MKPQVILRDSQSHHIHDQGGWTVAAGRFITPYLRIQCAPLAVGCSLGLELLISMCEALGLTCNMPQEMGSSQTKQGVCT